MKTIDLATLESIAAQRRFDKKTLEIAKRHLVYGEDVKRLAMEHGVHLQRVYAIRREVLAAASAIGVPAGWTRITLEGPRDVMARVKRLYDEEMAKLQRSA